MGCNNKDNNSNNNSSKNVEVDALLRLPLDLATVANRCK